MLPVISTMATTPDEDESASKEGGARRLVLIGAAAIILAAGSAVGFALHHSRAKSGEKAEPEVKAVMHLDPFVVNLSDPEGDRFLRVGIDLGLNREQKEHGDTGQAAMSLARTRDAILSILTACDAQTLVTPEGKASLKDKLTRSLRERAPELGVQEIYFNEFLVQR